MRPAMVVSVVLGGALACGFCRALASLRGGSGSHRRGPNHQRRGLLCRRRDGVLPRRRPVSLDCRVPFGGTNLGAARHRRARSRGRDGFGGLLYNAVGRGIAMKIVADQASIRPGYGFSSLLVRKDHVDSGRYKGYGDLKGMKVAVGAPGTGSASALNEALKQGGLKFSDVDVVYLGFPEHLPAYKNKGIDASITNEPTMRRAIEQGAAVRVAGNDVIYPRQQTAVMFFSDHFITNKRALAEGFMRAYIRGVRIYNDALKDGRLAGPRANDVTPILTRYTAIKDESLFRRIVPSWVDPNGEVDATSLKKDLDFFRELGLIEKKDISVDAVVDSSFAKAAVAKLGPYQPSAN